MFHTCELHGRLAIKRSGIQLALMCMFFAPYLVSKLYRTHINFLCAYKISYLSKSSRILDSTTRSYDSILSEENRSDSNPDSDYLAQDGRLRLHFRLPFFSFDPKAIYSVPRTMFRVSKVLDEILVSFAPLPSLFEDQDPIGKNPRGFQDLHWEKTTFKTPLPLDLG